MFNKNVNKNKLKTSLVESIQRNKSCIDYLTEQLSRAEDMYKLSELRADEVVVEQIKWILFQIEYNNDLMSANLKKLGGNADGLQPFEWK